MIALGGWPERPSACSKNASADAVSRCSRSSTSTTWPYSSTARYRYHLCLPRKKNISSVCQWRPSGRRVLASFSCQLRPERLDPTQHSPVRHVDASLGQQLHHASARERVAQVPTHGHQDHVGGPPIAREGGGGPKREVPAAAGAVEALATMAVMAVT